MNLQIKRAYDTSSRSDGYRILVDRYYPRGLTKEKANYRLWLKDISPTTELIKWFHEDPDKRWNEFQKKYKAELKTADKKLLLEQLVKLIKIKKNVTLLYGSKNETHNNAIILLTVLKKHL
jgi:uncharacterized protein YeaO (DUF488 family)